MKGRRRRRRRRRSRYKYKLLKKLLPFRSVRIHQKKRL